MSRVNKTSDNSANVLYSIKSPKQSVPSRMF